MRTLPTLVIPLRGQVALNLRAASSVDAEGRLVSTFAAVPDAPVSRFELTLAGGKKGILVVNGKACDRSRTALTTIGGQNGRALNRTATMNAPCGGAASKKAAKRR